MGYRRAQKQLRGVLALDVLLRMNAKSVVFAGTGTMHIYVMRKMGMWLAVNVSLLLLNRKCRLALIVGALPSPIVCHAQSLNAVQELANLGKVWGFLKYFHPGLGDGSINWD